MMQICNFRIRHSSEWFNSIWIYHILFYLEILVAM